MGVRIHPPIGFLKRVYQDQLMDGANSFAPCKCKAFCYSRIKKASYKFPVPVKTDLVCREVNKQDTDTAFDIDTVFFQAVELRRLPGPPCEDGFYSYILEDQPEKALGREE